MRLLLDTQALLWVLQDSNKLGSKARLEIANAEVVYVSAASILEATIKSELGKVKFPDNLVAEIGRSGFKPLEISLEHARGITQAVLPHRDPVDRLLLSQAHYEQLAFVTADEFILAAYGVGCVDARI